MSCRNPAGTDQSDLSGKAARFQESRQAKGTEKGKEKRKTGEEKEMNVISGIIKNDIPSPVKELFPTFTARVDGGPA